jgi:cobalt/nickel transport system permease protein
MHFNVADSYEDTGSPLHLMDARVKVALVFLMILLIALTPMGAFGAYIGFFVIMMAGALIARVDPLMVVKRSLVALPFAAAAITLVFTMPGPSLGNVPLVGWPISVPGLIRFASIMFKSTISVQAAVLLMASTHFTDMIWALSALRVPKVLVSIISFMYRYLFVLAEEALRLTRARDSRSAVIGGNPAYGGSVIFRAQTSGRLIGNLFTRSFERSERVYQAMVSRGYRGEMKHLAPPPLRARDVLAAAGVLAAGLLLVMASVML